MPSTGQIILPQYNSSGDWNEKLITPENGKVLGFDGNLDPVMVSAGWNVITLKEQPLPHTTIVDLTNLVLNLSANQGFIIRMIFATVATSSTQIFAKHGSNMTYSGYVVSSTLPNELRTFSAININGQKNIMTLAAGVHELRISGQCLSTPGSFKLRATQYNGASFDIQRVVFEYILF